MCWEPAGSRGPPCAPPGSSLQGYLVHKKPPPRRTLQLGYAWVPVVILGGGGVELVSDDLTRILSERLPKFQSLSLNFCTRISFERTDRVVNIDLYYTSGLMMFGSFEVFRQKSVQPSETGLRTGLCSARFVPNLRKPEF